jgi:hypothetical protein
VTRPTDDRDRFGRIAGPRNLVTTSVADALVAEREAA